MLQALSESRRVYCPHPQDTTLFDWPHRGQYKNRQAVGAHVHGRPIRPSDMENPLCGPKDVPAYDQDPILQNRLRRQTGLLPHDIGNPRGAGREGLRSREPSSPPRALTTKRDSRTTGPGNRAENRRASLIF